MRAKAGKHAKQPHISSGPGIPPVLAAAMITSAQPSGICGMIGTKSATSHGVAWRVCRLWLAFATMPAILGFELAEWRPLLVTAAAGPTMNRSAVAAVITFRSWNDGDGAAWKRNLRCRLLPHSAIARRIATPTAWMLGIISSVPLRVLRNSSPHAGTNQNGRLIGKCVISKMEFEAKTVRWEISRKRSNRSGGDDSRYPSVPGGCLVTS